MAHALSEAEHKERSDAARARWARHLTAAVAGGAAAAGAHVALRARHRADWATLRRAFRVSIAPEKAHHALRDALIGKRDALWRTRLASVWPVPAERARLWQQKREAQRHFRTAPMEQNIYGAGERPADEFAWDMHRDRLIAATQAIARLEGAVPPRKTLVSDRQYTLSPYTRAIKVREPASYRKALADYHAMRNRWHAEIEPKLISREPLTAEEEEFDRTYAFAEKPKRPKPRTIFQEVKPKEGKLHSASATTRRIEGTPGDRELSRIRVNLRRELDMHTMRRDAAEQTRYHAALQSARAQFRSRAKPIVRWMPDRRARLALTAAAALGGAALGYLATPHSRSEPLAKADPADTDAPAPDSSDQLADVADKAERKLGPRLAAMFRLWKDDATADLLSPRRASLLTTVHTDLDRALRPLHDVGLEGAAIPPQGGEAEQSAGAPDQPRGIAFSLATRAPQAEGFLSQLRHDKIVGLVNDQKVAIRDLLLDAARSGASPDDMARRIRRTIGLTATQAQHVENYREELLTLDPAALQRALRDKRYDGPIQRAILEQDPLSDAQVDRFVDAYHRRYLAYRAMTIARTEAVGFANNGHVAAVQTMLDEDPGWTVIKTWNAKRDELTRPDHFAQHGQSVIGINTPFVMASGDRMRWPHDPKGKARQVINCRCTVSIRLVRRASAVARGTDAVQPFARKETEDA